MKRLALKTILWLREWQVFLAEIRAHDARRTFEAAQAELYRSHGWSEIRDEELATLRRKADLAYAHVARHDRHKELGIA